jgi:hypothetical protein
LAALLVFEFEPVVYKLRVLRQGVARRSKGLVHLIYRLKVLLLELRIQKVNYLLECLVSNHLLEWLPAERCWRFALGAGGLLGVFNKVAVDARFAKAAKALVDGMRVTEIAGAHGTLEEPIEVTFLDALTRIFWQLFK